MFRQLRNWADSRERWSCFQFKWPEWRPNTVGASINRFRRRRDEWVSLSVEDDCPECALVEN